MSGKRIGGTCFFKIDGNQLSLTGGIEVPLKKTVKESVTGLDGSNDYTEKFRAPFIKGTFKVPKDFPLDDLDRDDMTITAELANGWVYVLKNAWVEGEADHNAEEGTAELQFSGAEGFHQ